MVETSVARMMGEDPSYVRPMDASETKRGPLVRAGIKSDWRVSQFRRVWARLFPLADDSPSPLLFLLENCNVGQSGEGSG